MLLLQMMMLLLLPVLHHAETDEFASHEGPGKSLTSHQRVYFQSRWKQRSRFTTTPQPGQTPEPWNMRMVYPCYCYKPPQPGKTVTEQYEKYMSEPDDIFIFNR